MSDHPFDAPLDVRLANLRAWKARAGTLAPTLEARLQALEFAAETTHAERASQPFRIRFPALTKWAAEVTAHQRKRTPLEVAAAFELVAVQCEEAGQWELAARALQLAAQSLDRATAA